MLLFFNVCIDLFGPFTIKGKIKKRIRGKAYGVLITCLSSRAVYIEVSADYSTDSFLHVLRRMACIPGWPKKIFSDRGTQLVGASNELRKQFKDLDWKSIRELGYENGVLEWCFSPGDAPW